MSSLCSRLLALFSCVLFTALPALAQGARTMPRESHAEALRCSWDERFYITGFNGTVFDTLEFNDGSGPALYAAGDFTAFESTPLLGIGRWDGSSWQPLGPGLNASVSTLVVFDDGSGPALYAGGEFTRSGRREVSYIARWDGTWWRNVGDDLDGPVRQLVIHDDGSGPALYARGDFSFPASYGLGRWDGAEWTALPPLVGSVEALASYDDGESARLFVGGSFELLTPDPDDPIDFPSVVVLDGSTWRRVGEEIRPSRIEVLTVLDDGSGPALYATSVQQSSLASPPSGVYKWDGHSWQLLAMPGIYAIPRDLAVFDEGTGEALYVGGHFGSEVWGSTGLMRWNGVEWLPIAAAASLTQSLQVWDSAGGPLLLLAGSFNEGGAASTGLVGWDGTTWRPAPGARGDGLGLEGSGSAMVAYDDGSGPGIVVSGFFTAAGGDETIARMARWDGQSWSTVGDSFSTAASDLAVFDAGDGPRLVASVGQSLQAGPTVINGVAVLDGNTWGGLGGGTDGPVFTLTEHDDGSGPALYAGGRFTVAGQTPASYVARWDGKAWSAVADGLDGDVYDLTVYDDGSGVALYATGEFGAAFGHARIVRWDGTSWSTLGLSYPPVDTLGLRVFDDGTGPELYAFRSSFEDQETVLRWDGTQWLPLGKLQGIIWTLEMFDRGQGPELFAVGSLSLGDGVHGGLARWDGTNWVDQSRLLDGAASVALVLEDSSSSVLFVAGNFRNAEGAFSSGIGRYSCKQP